MRHPLIAATKAIASVLIASASLFADEIVDNTFDNNQNEFEYYWYYYDDNSGGVKTIDCNRQHLERHR